MASRALRHESEARRTADGSGRDGPGVLYAAAWLSTAAAVQYKYQGTKGTAQCEEGGGKLLRQRAIAVLVRLINFTGLLRRERHYVVDDGAMSFAVAPAQLGNAARTC